MQVKISHRMSKPDFQADFLAGILRAAADPNIISFAGGLPNPVSFPVREMDEAAEKMEKLFALLRQAERRKRPAIQRFPRLRASAPLYLPAL